MNLLSASDEQLLKPARVDSAEAFGTFYRRYERPVAAFHLRRAPLDLVPDLTAETFLCALDARHRFKARGDGSAARWLFGIAHNVLATSARRSASDSDRIRALADIQRGLSSYQRDELTRLQGQGGVLTALEGLPVAARDAVRGYVLDDHTYAELATANGTIASAMRKRVSRGLGLLREQLTEQP